MAILIRTVLASALLLGGCTRPSDPIVYSEPHYAVHSVVFAGVSEVAVAVERFDPISRTHGLAAAAVSMTRASTVYPLAPLPSARRCAPDLIDEPAPGCYGGTLSPSPAAGEEWGLAVDLPDGTRVTGRARLPVPPDILSPLPGFRVHVANGGMPVREGALYRPVGQLTLDWTTSPEIGLTTIGVQPIEAWSQSRRIPDHCYVPTPVEVRGAGRSDHVLDILSATCGTSASPVAWDSMRVRLRLVVHDTAYARYVRDVRDADAVRKSLASVGLVGAYGVFTGAASAEVPLLLVADPPQ
jgi:hypothetical protein